TNIPVGSGPDSVFIDPSGLHIYVPINGEGVVDVIDTQTYAITTQVHVPTIGYGRMSTDGSRLYIADYVGNTIAVIDTSSNTVVDTITGITAPGAMAITPDGSKLYVAAAHYETEIIDLATDHVIATVPDLSGLS